MVGNEEAKTLEESRVRTEMPDHNQLAASTPTVPGYYWHRQVDEGSQEVFEWEVVQVLSEQDGPGIIISGTTFQASEISAVWGPRIPDPDEKQEEAEDAASLNAVLQESQSELREQRDMFAAFALVGFLGNAAPNRPTHDCQTAAQIAYNYADAMIEEREKRQ